MFGERMAIEHYQKAGVVVAGQREAMDADVVINAVVRHIESADARQRLGQGPVSVFADVAGGNDGDVGRRFFQGLRVQGGCLDDG